MYLCSFGYSIEEDSVIIHFFKAAAPNEFSVMDGNIGAAITHILSSVDFKIYRLNNHQAL
jgi:hypothetical protein